VGLAAMRERVEAVGGVLAVESGPGGAVVTATLPLDPGSAAGAVSSEAPALGENGV
jgi:signal transduction histidine kinase